MDASISIEDAFWDICLIRPANVSELNELESEVRHEDVLLQTNVNHHRTDTDGIYEDPVIVVSPAAPTHSDQCDYDIDMLRVTLLECQDEGVFSSVSTQIWEAAVLLSAYLLRRFHKNESIPPRVLELGCGCGLVGISCVEIRL